MSTIFTNSINSYAHLMSLIKNTRTQMIQSAFDRGFTSPETVKISQQLDYYLNLELKQRHCSI